MILVYCTFPSSKECTLAARALVRKKLGACAEIIPASTCYEWKGKLVTAKEWILLLVAKDANYKRIEAFLSKTHSHDVPAIFSIPVGKSYKKYRDWVEGV